MSIQQGQFVEVRGRPWLVEAVDDREPDLTTLRLSRIPNDAQGEQIEVLWDAEVGSRITSLLSYLLNDLIDLHDGRNCFVLCDMRLERCKLRGPLVNRKSAN